MTLAPEEQLVLAAARTDPDERARGRVAALEQRPLDWQYVLETAVRHGVAPLVDHGLRATHDGVLPASMPAQARERLTALAELSAARTARLLPVLDEVLSGLREHHVPTLGLKDLGLALEVFPEPGLRPLGDLDLLIRREDYADARAVMTGAGFEPLPREDLPYTLRHAWAHHFRREDGNVWVDLQWNVLQREWGAPGVGRRSFDPDVLWEGAHDVEIPVAGAPTLLVPAPEAMLFHLCSHLEGHAYGELVLFCDIAEALRHWGDTLDWDRLVTLADRFEARATVHHVLALSRALLDAPVPEAPLSALGRDVFRGAVFPAMFGGLGSLHGALDDIQATANPPRSLLDRLEADVRRHAACARAFYDEVDALASGILAAGSELVVLDAEGEGRRFPDPAIPPFGTVRLAVLDEDAEHVHRALEQRGLAPSADGTRARRITVADDVVDEGAAVLFVRATVRSGAPVDGGAEPRSNRAAAVRSLAARLGGERGADDAVKRADIEVHVVTREALLTWLLARLGERRYETLFAVPPVADLLRLGRRPPQAGAVAEQAHALGVTAAVTRGVAIAQAASDRSAVLAELSDLLGRPPTPARALTWAREGPEGLARHGELRPAYLLALCALQARRDELPHVVRRALRRRGGDPAPLVHAAGSLLHGLPHLVRPVATAPAIYWLEG